VGKFGTDKRILFLFAVLAVLLIITSSFLFYTLAQTRTNLTILSEESTKLGLLSDIRGSNGEIHISVLHFAIASDPADMDVETSAIHDYHTQNEEMLNQIQKYLETASESQLYDQVIQIDAGYDNAVQQLLNMRTASQSDRLAFNIANVRPVYDNLSSKLSAFSSEIVNTSQTRQAQAQSQINLFQNLGIALLVVSITLILALAWLTLTIIRNLRRDKAALARETEQRQQAIIELEASNRELESFAYSVSHDLRTPLRSLEGFSEALLEDYQDQLDEQGKRYLGRIQDASIVMGRLIDDILTLSRITRAELSKQKVDLSQIAESVTADLRKNEPERHVEVIISPGLVVEGDSRLLRLVMENLIGNSWKFTSKTLSPKIEFGLTYKEGVPTYFVRDNGAGFDMAYAVKLFQPFQRLHKSTDYSGTGIGLATVQRIVRRHGGQIWVEAEEGKGATFFFTLV
jgi:signal transduction histidine kinase